MKHHTRISSLGARARSGAITVWLFTAGAVSPALLTLWVQKKHWINIPIWDEWDTPGIALLRCAQRSITWGDLFAQHNESRKVLPRLIHIVMASIAGWDVRQGMVLTFLCACAASASVFVYLRKRAGAANFQVLFAWLLANVLLFAPSQYENFLSGFAFEILIPFLCLFGCIAINLSSWRLPAKAIANSLLALVASYTFAHGMLLWTLAWPIPTRAERSSPRRIQLCLLSFATYAAIGAISIAYYFVGFTRPYVAPRPAALTQFPRVLEFIVVWLGSVLRSAFLGPRLAGAVISVIIAATVAFTFVLLKKNKKLGRNYYPWLLLLAFALSSGALTAIGRVNLGIDLVFNTWFNGFSSMRYNATSVFACVAVIGLVFNLYEDRIRFQIVLRSRFLIGLTVFCTLLAVAWTEMFSDESTRITEFQANRKRARTAVIWINALPENPEIFLAYPYPDGFWQRVEEMRSANLIKLPKVSDSLRQAISATPNATGFEAGSLDRGEPRLAGHFRFAGWGRNPVTNVRADYVVLGWEGTDNMFHPFAALPTGQVRPDIAKVVGPLSLKAGFDQEIEVSRLPQQAVTIRGWAVDWNAQQAFPLNGTLQLERPPL